MMRIPTTVATGVAALSAAAVTAAFVPGPAAATGTAASAAPTATSAVAADADRQRPAGTYTSKVRGEFGRDGTVRGTFRPQRFFAKGGEVFAEGTLRAVARRGNGAVVGMKTREIVVPVRNASAQERGRRTCDILNLVLGPLDLNLLGLEVHLNRVVLDIVGRTGPGNLLGNLLCAVAGLLDGTELTAIERLRLANILNRILNLLG